MANHDRRPTDGLADELTLAVDHDAALGFCSVCPSGRLLTGPFPDPIMRLFRRMSCRGQGLSHPATFVLKHHHHRHSTETLCSPLFARLGQLHTAPKIPVRRGLHVLSYTPPPPSAGWESLAAGMRRRDPPAINDHGFRGSCPFLDPAPILPASPQLFST